MTTIPRSLEGGDAFSLYLEARSRWNRRTPAALREAIRLLERAISLKGTFALACAALADCYSILMDYGVLSPREGLTQAKLAAGRALHLGPSLAEAMTSAAIVRQMDLDWPTAEEEFRAAIEAHPGYAVAHQRYGLLLAWMGRWQEARQSLDIAETLDPHSPAITASRAWLDYYEGRYSNAIQGAADTLGHSPGFSSAQAVLSLSLVQTGQSSRAAHFLRASLGREEENVSLLSLLAYARGRAGDSAEAEETLAQLRSRSSTRFVSPYYLAVPLLGTGDFPGAMRALEEAEASRSPQLVYLAADPIFTPLRHQPGFRNLLKRLRLPPTWLEASDQDAEEVA